MVGHYRSRVRLPFIAAASLVALSACNSDPTAPPVDADARTLAGSASVSISPGQNIQKAVNSLPQGATILIKAGIHRRQTIVPKSGMTFVGENGAVLDGENSAEYAFIADKNYANREADNVTLRNLEIRNYRSELKDAAVHVGGNSPSDGWVIEDCKIHHNFSAGIRVGDRMVVRDNSIHHNGQIGLVGGGVNILVVNNEISYNNTRDVQKTLKYWEFGGTKFVKTRNLVVRNNHSHHNNGDGFWFDTDNIDALVEGNRIVDNARGGIHWEISYDAVIRNNYLEGNGFGEDAWHRGAIRISSSSNVEVYGNTVVDNQAGIVAITQNRGSGMYGKREVKNLFVHDNVIKQNRRALSGLGITTTGDLSYFTSKGNRWSRNLYLVDDRAGARWKWKGGMARWDTWRSVHDNESLTLR